MIVWKAYIIQIAIATFCLSVLMLCLQSWMVRNGKLTFISFNPYFLKLFRVFFGVAGLFSVVVLGCWATYMLTHDAKSEGYFYSAQIEDEERGTVNRIDKILNKVNTGGEQ